MNIQIDDVVETINGVGIVKEVRNQGSIVYLICTGEDGFGGDSDVYSRDEFDVV